MIRGKRSNIIPTDNITLEERQVPWKSKLKYLGVTIDRTVSHLCQSLYNKVKAVRARLYPTIDRTSTFDLAKKVVLIRIFVLYSMNMTW